MLHNEPIDHTDPEYDEWAEKQFDTCTGCGVYKPNKVRQRYSFGVYAGRLCENCCLKYRDHCGIDRPQGSPNELILMGENYWEEPDIPVYGYDDDFNLD